ncbi:MAG: alpha/beta fold hydrolase [Candidatus Marinimicrobia bacterium]|nr:alpha/beta fold hydrolase [Candidatus Neomarinimicrobiota bacterium]
MTASAGQLISEDNIELGSGPAGVYLIHGFTGSTYEFQGLATYLADAGYRVQARLLAGHGTTVEECNLVSAQDWLTETEFHFTEMLLDCDTVFAVGLSMGAGLALHLGGLFPVAGVVAMSTVLGINPVKRPWLLPLAAPFVTSIQKASVYHGKNPAGHRYYGYDSYPVKGTREMIRLNRLIRGKLSEMNSPLLMMHSKADITADFRNAQIVFDAVGSTDKQLATFEKSGHILPDGSEKEAVWETLLAFIAARTPQPAEAG